MTTAWILLRTSVAFVYVPCGKSLIVRVQIVPFLSTFRESIASESRAVIFWINMLVFLSAGFNQWELSVQTIPIWQTAARCRPHCRSTQIRWGSEVGYWVRVQAPRRWFSQRCTQGHQNGLLRSWISQGKYSNSEFQNLQRSEYMDYKILVSDFSVQLHLTQTNIFALFSSLPIIVAAHPPTQFIKTYNRGMCHLKDNI